MIHDEPTREPPGAVDLPLTRGFLPETDPLTCLPAPFDVWEAFGRELSKLLLTPHLRPAVERLPPFPVDRLTGERELERAMTLLSYIGNLYVFPPDQPPAEKLPANLAQAWVAVARRLDRPPVLTYASQALTNWRRIDPHGPVAVGNLVLVQNFLGGMDEEWFVTIHTTIEAAAGPALQLLRPAQRAIAAGNPEPVARALRAMAATLDRMGEIFRRMPERCDPEIYYHRVRPFMFGWKDNPLLPDGLIYDGVAEFGGRPVEFRGETGAQSSIIPAFDAALGIEHEFDEMRAYLVEMRAYMPHPHRRVLEELERGPSIRAFVDRPAGSVLKEIFNEAVDALARFRRLHIEFAAAYILKPARQESALGTGGTPFTVYLKKHIRETEAQRLD